MRLQIGGYSNQLPTNGLRPPLCPIVGTKFVSEPLLTPHAYPLYPKGQKCGANSKCDACGRCVFCGDLQFGQCPLSIISSCQEATCDEATSSIVTSPAPRGTACEDGNPCTLSDKCDGKGNCVPGLLKKLPVSDCSYYYCDSAWSPAPCASGESILASTLAITRLR